MNTLHCLCDIFSQLPSADAILQTALQHTVCTPTACYAGDEDAYGVVDGARGSTLQLVYSVLFGGVVLMLAAPVMVRRLSNASTVA